MKKILYIIASLFLFVGLCSCEQKDEALFKSGSCIAVAEVSASEGSLSVLVQTSGTWRLSCDADWLSFDVKGGNGRQAFTISYGSNVPDILNLKSARTAKIAISLDEPRVSDTLLFVQRGFLGKDSDASVKPDDRITLEFDSAAITDGTFVCCSSDGLDDDTALRSWIGSVGADAFVLDGTVEGSLTGGSIGIAGCNFEGLSADDEYAAFKAAVNSTVNSSFDGGNRWIVAGQMYHYSSMQTGYPSTPAWYPTNAKGPDFRSDRYAWQNNLYDAVWMAKQDYVTTWTDSLSHSYSADYVYLSSSVLGSVSSVELVNAPVSGMTHKAIILNLKY